MNKKLEILRTEGYNLYEQIIANRKKQIELIIFILNTEYNLREGDIVIYNEKKCRLITWKDKYMDNGLQAQIIDESKNQGEKIINIYHWNIDKIKPVTK